MGGAKKRSLRQAEKQQKLQAEKQKKKTVKKSKLETSEKTSRPNIKEINKSIYEQGLSIHENRIKLERFEELYKDRNR